MNPEKVPVFVPRYVTPVRVDCECRRKQLDLEFKTAIIEWICTPGESVKEGQVLCEVEVEKVIAEVPSPADGILNEICIPDGGSCDVHRPVGYIIPQTAC